VARPAARRPAPRGLRPPAPFDLDLTARSHGFYTLAPWVYDAGRRILGRALTLSSGRTAFARVEGDALALAVAAAGRISAGERREVEAQLRRCLGLDEDLAPFYARIRELEAAPPRQPLPGLGWAAARGAGRLLRSPTVFEDVVKTLCTTNCTFALTRHMVRNLVERLGAPAPEGRAFPSAAAMAERPERFYREVVRAGYRAGAMRAIAVEVARGGLDVEGWRDPGLDTAELALRIRALPGFGPYATEHLLKLLGRHERLALDSWSRAKLARLRGCRRRPTDRAIERWYRPYGRFAGLAMWLEVTADWHGATPSWP
jgi:N-glycosylase/DNA lyase